MPELTNAQLKVGINLVLSQAVNQKDRTSPALSEMWAAIGVLAFAIDRILEDKV